ncbi:MAG: sulfatase-like hydrolase/transferase [Haloarculaceae archaeon]
MPPYDVLLVTIDSLRRDFLGAYRDRPRVVDYDVATPNLDRFAERAAVFDNHYAGSMPCMPARREFTCGVQEFLWRPWGPVEPFDETVPALAGEAGAVTQLVTDHYHYFEHGGRGYFEDYDGFEFVRGHEFDHWQTAPRRPDERHIRQNNRVDADPADVGPGGAGAYARNVADLDDLDERDFFAPRVFSRAAEWIGENADWDQWFCYVDSFDVHEPFHCPEPYASMYTDEDPTDPDLVHWPDYAPVEEQGLSERQMDFVRSQFAGKVTMVDRWFGRVLDRLDREDAWDDTVVVVTSDHGEMLGEHGYVMKNYMPVYDALANTPLMIHHPDGHAGRVDAVTSAVDVYATLLESLGAEVPDATHSRSLLPLVAGDADDHREYALYGYFGADACITDGRYTYFQPGDPDATVNVYSTMHMAGKDGDAEVASLPYTDDAVWRYPAGTGSRQATEPMLFDTDADPEQTENLADDRPGEVERMRGLLADALTDLEAPDEQFDRLGLS